MDREEKQAWMDEIVAILQTTNPSLVKNKTLCKWGHSKTNNTNKHGRCSVCAKDRVIADKRKRLGSGSVWY